MVTLRDIAKEVNVSVPLVSKVLNNSSGTAGASKQTADAIRHVADKLGYRRNRAAAALTTGKQDAIGVLMHCQGAMGSGVAELMLHGIAEATAEHDLFQQQAFYDTSQEAVKLLRRMDLRSVDGLIVAGIAHGELRDEMLHAKNAGTPVITIHHSPVSSEFPNIGCTHEDLGYAATKHLLDQGCRRILHIMIYDERLEGYYQALKGAGIPIDEKLVVKFENFVPDSKSILPDYGERAVAKLLDEGVEFDAVMAQCDVFAMGAIRELVHRGISVPGDVKVVGIDNSPYCDLILTPLSSVSTNCYERGRLAVEGILTMREGGVIETRNIPPQVFARESTR